MKKSKQKPLPLPAEYRLLASYKYSPTFKKMVIYIALRTIEEFSNFLYEIVVEDKIKGNTLCINIHGLRPPRQTLPSFGPASFEKEFPNMENIEEIIVQKLDGFENAFQVKLLRDNMIIRKSPKETFVQLVTKEEEW
ncbi:MAG: hypothetical protein ACHQQQ_01915 [Bacteroidota bacterium]